MNILIESPRKGGALMPSRNKSHAVASAASLQMLELVLHVWRYDLKQHDAADATVIRRAARIAAAGANGLTEGERQFLRDEVVSGKRGLPKSPEESRLRQAIMNQYNAAKELLVLDGKLARPGAWSRLQEHLAGIGIHDIDGRVLSDFDLEMRYKLLLPATDNCESPSANPPSDLLDSLNRLDEFAPGFAADLAIRFPESVAGLNWNRDTNSPADDQIPPPLSTLMTAAQIAVVVSRVMAKRVAAKTLISNGVLGTATVPSKGGRGNESQWDYETVRPRLKAKYGSEFPELSVAWSIISNPL